MARNIWVVYWATIALLVLSFTAIHAMGAFYCARIMRVISSTPMETGVRDRLQDVRRDMVIFSPFQGIDAWPQGRPSSFGYHPWNATVWLAMEASCHELPDGLASTARLLARLRWAELAVLGSAIAIFFVAILRGFN